MISTATSLQSDQPEPLILQIGSISATMPYVFGSVYNASKAALHSCSNTLRLELAPFGLRVLLAMTGGVHSTLVDRLEATASLPPTCLYLPIAEDLARRQPHSAQGAMTPEAYAHILVGDALKSPAPKEVWRGSYSGMMWYINTFLGRWVFDIGYTKMFGLDKLKSHVMASRDRKRV